MPYYREACNSLSYEQRVRRLADHFKRRPDGPGVAGVCQVCGHGLPVAYRSVQVVDQRIDPQTDRMGMKVVEVGPGSEGALRLEARIAAHDDLSGLFADGRSVLRVCACDRMDEQVWVDGKKLRQKELAEERAKKEQGNTEPARKLRSTPGPRRLAERQIA